MRSLALKIGPHVPNVVDGVDHAFGGRPGITMFQPTHAGLKTAQVLTGGALSEGRCGKFGDSTQDPIIG